MGREAKGLAAIAACVVLSALAAVGSTPSGAAPVESAKGQGTANSGSGEFKFSAKASGTAPGAATGTFKVHHASGDVVEGNVTCLLVGANLATVGGTVTKSTGGNLDGWEFVFRVRDDPSGDAFNQDNYVFDASNPCENTSVQPLPLDKGQIKVVDDGV